jgi:hydrogenase nickel incorporation protein HypA/HybF
MHELSIAEAIVAIAERHADGRRVARVEVQVGHLRQVVPSALEFAFQLVAEGTVLEGAELELTDVPAQGRCRGCGAESVLHDFPLHCSACGGFDLELLRGEELLVDALELDDEALTAKGGTVHGD